MNCKYPIFPTADIGLFEFTLLIDLFVVVASYFLIIPLV